MARRLRAVPWETMLSDRLPLELQAAVIRVLDAEAESQREPSSERTRSRRERLLTGARSALADWTVGKLTTSEAIAALDALVTGSSRA
jgi:hypothetical protein